MNDDTFNVPYRYKDAERFTKGMNVSDIKQLESFDKGAYFYGENAVANTKQLVGWYKHARLWNQSCVYVDWSDVIVSLMTDPKTSYNELLAKTCPVMFIDDFCDGRTGVVQDIIYNFIKRCYNTYSIMYFTSRELVCTERLAYYIGKMTLQFQVEAPNGN